MSGKPTIDLVARHAGVAKSTVSYVLSGKRKVSAEVAARVQKAIEELRYKPGNSRGAHSPSRRANIVGLFMPALQSHLSEDLFNYPLIEGAMEALSSLDYRLLLHRIPEEMDPNSGFEFDIGHYLQGVLLNNPRVDHAYLDRLRSENVPFVIIGTPEVEQNIFYVDIDIISAAYRAADYLLAKGHEKIFLINTPKNYVQSNQRLKGFQLAFQEHGVSLDPIYLVHAHVEKEEGRRICETMLQANPQATAVIASNEIVARGVIEILEEKNIKIPDKMAVMAMGGNPIGQLTSPRITTIDFSPYSMGYEAAKMLVEVIRNERIRPAHILLPTKFVEGQTA